MLNPKSLLKVLPAVLLSFVQVVGMSELARSQSLPPQQVSQSEEIDRLIQQLKSPDPKVRSDAARALGKMGESAKAAIPNLIPLLQDPEPNVRSRAALALGRMGESAKATIPNLIPLLKDSDPYVRWSAAEALKKLGYQP
jgi:HEAT repeat protein